MGNCDSRKHTESPYSPNRKRCGYYNDWIDDNNFCMPTYEAGNKDAGFCSAIGGWNEWNVKTPSHQQNIQTFVFGGGNSPIQLTEAVNRISSNPGDILDRKIMGINVIKSSQFQNMRDSISNSNAITGINISNGNKDIGPLYATDVDGKTIPLWSAYLRNAYVEEYPSCIYDSWTLSNVQSVGCCSKDYESCGFIDGVKTLCIRDNFAANLDQYGDIACCFNDLVCEPEADQADRPFAPPGQDGLSTPWANNPKCFRSGTSSDFRTCNPESRSLGSSYCANTLKDYCTGKQLFPGQSDWLESWDDTVVTNVNEADIENDLVDAAINVKGPCKKALIRQIGGKGVCGQDFDTFEFNAGEANPAGLLWASDVMDGVFEKYFTEYGSPLLGPNEDGIEASVGSNSFLYDMCKKMPILCSNALTEMCSQMTEERIAANPSANKWCGCYMPSEQYAKYSAGSFLVSPECTPFCSQNDVIPRVTTDGNVKYCEQSICIINDTIIDMVDTKGNVDFNEICPRCAQSQNNFTVDGSTTSNSSDGKYLSDSVTSSSNQVSASSCQCKLDNTTFTALDSKFGNLNLSTNCGGSQCLDSDGNSIACSSNKTELLTKLDDTVNKIKVSKLSSKFKKIAILVGCILLLGAIVYFLFVYRKKIFHITKGFTKLKPGETFKYNKGLVV